MNVLIVCAAGMSSGALTLKLRAAVKDNNPMDLRFGFCDASQVNQYAAQSDLILLAPQMSFLKEKIEKVGDTRILIMSAEMYGIQDTDAILKLIESGEEKEEKVRARFLHDLALRLSESRALSAISGGFMDLLPISLIGSIFTLLLSFPVQAVKDMILSSPICSYLELGKACTLGCVSLYLCFTVSHRYMKLCGGKARGVSLATTICFILLTNSIGAFGLDPTWFDTSGLFTAIFVSIVVSKIYCAVYERLKTSHLSAFEMNTAIQELLAFVPLFLCVCLSLVLADLLQHTPYGVLPVFVQGSLQNRLAMFFGNSATAQVLISLLANVFWFFGIHGGNVVNPIMKPIYAALDLENLTAYSMGQPLPNLVGSNLMHMYTFGGAGSTLGLVLLMCFFAKSSKFRMVGRISLVMSLFFINEPVLFGLPVVLNPMVLIPFLFIAPLSGVLTIFMMRIGVLPYCNGMQIPWTTPPIISGFLQGGIRLAVWQLLMIALSGLLWYPFFVRMDRMEVEKEKN